MHISSFGMLKRRLWNESSVRLKINVYKAVILTNLLYGYETSTVYRCYIKLLEQFQQRCLRSICTIRWQDKVSNVEVLERCVVPSTESLIIKIQLRWEGARMLDGGLTNSQSNLLQCIKPGQKTSRQTETDV